MKTVVILKAESESSDTYAEEMKAHNINAIFVPTLGFGFKKLDELKEKLMSPENYLGILFTSPRSVDAVKEALQSDSLPEEWKSLHNFCVGTVTYSLIKSTFGDVKVLGKESGNASNLADFIKEHFEGDFKKPFLFPSGNLRQETLQEKLAPFGFLFDAFEVYETVCHPDLAENLSLALAEKSVEYLAFFSPSGVTHVNEQLVKNNISVKGKKLIAIGPSTRKALENNGLEVYRTAEKPSVEYLIKVLVNPDAPAAAKGAA